MGEAIITRRGGGILKIAGQTEEIVKFGEAINKYDPVCVKSDTCFKTNLMSDVFMAGKAGYAKESGVAGEYKKIVVIFR
jgi:hypothetical protein